MEFAKKKHITWVLNNEILIHVLQKSYAYLDIETF